jgi:hypothetical protein
LPAFVIITSHRNHISMLEAAPAGQVDLTSYPREGVRISIQHHKETVGLHRLRLSFPGEIGDVLKRGLYAPRLIIDGTAVNGLRIWCAPEGGLAPAINRSSRNWSATLPVRRVRAREAIVGSTDVEVTWQLDETGPVMLIPRLPDVLLPESVIDKLPNSQVDHETRMDRADKRLAREMAALQEDAPEPPPAPVEPPPPSAVDLKELLVMVNELVDQMGESVALTIDEHGHVQAKRRIVQYIDL